MISCSLRYSRLGICVGLTVLLPTHASSCCFACQDAERMGRADDFSENGQPHCSLYLEGLCWELPPFFDGGERGINHTMVYSPIGDYLSSFVSMPEQDGNQEKMSLSFSCR